jgi:FkbM family methyltransferase
MTKEKNFESNGFFNLSRSIEITGKLVYVNSPIIGNYYALQSIKSSKPFKNSMRECKSVILNSSDIVADIGAYIGEYSRYAILNGAKKVLSYEPTPNTFKILSKNALPNMKLFNLTVVGNDDRYVDLYISKGIGVTNSIAKSYKKAGMIKVKAINYRKAIEAVTIVKIDVEGGEYSYDIIQPQLRAIILEFHPIVGKPWKVWANKIINNIEDAGFKPIMKLTFKNGWSLTGSWQR